MLRPVTTELLAEKGGFERCARRFVATSSSSPDPEISSECGPLPGACGFVGSNHPSAARSATPAKASGRRPVGVGWPRRGLVEAKLRPAG